MALLPCSCDHWRASYDSPHPSPHNHSEHGVCRLRLSFSLLPFLGSESSGSVGSSTGSLSRSQPTHPVPALTKAGYPHNHSALPCPAAYPAVCASSTVVYEAGGRSAAPPANTANTSYYLLPLEATGIPPGSVLVNPHTGW